MNQDILLGILAGALAGIAITKVEMDIGSTGHMVIGSLAGATIGGLTIKNIKDGERK